MIAVLVTATIVTIGALIYLLLPLMLGGSRQQMLGWALLGGITVAAMGVYLWRGSPDIPSQPAAFQTSGPDYERREAVRQELVLREKVAAKPGDANLLLALGTAQLQNGRLDPALETLNKAHRADPNSSAILLKLGAAYYASAINASVNGEDRVRTKLHFIGALEYAPQDAPYRERLERDFETFKNQDAD